MENLPGDARSESRREFRNLNNLLVTIGCERHAVRLSLMHVTGFERNDGAAEAPFFFSWCLPAFFFLSSSHSRQTYHSTSIHTTSNPLALLFNPPYQILLLSSQWVSNRVRLPTPPTSSSSFQTATLSHSLNQLATLKMTVYGMRNSSSNVLQLDAQLQRRLPQGGRFAMGRGQRTEVPASPNNI